MHQITSKRYSNNPITLEIFGNVSSNIADGRALPEFVEIFSRVGEKAGSAGEEAMEKRKRPTIKIEDKENRGTKIGEDGHVLSPQWKKARAAAHSIVKFNQLKEKKNRERL